MNGWTCSQNHHKRGKSKDLKMCKYFHLKAWFACSSIWRLRLLVLVLPFKGFVCLFFHLKASFACSINIYPTYVFFLFFFLQIWACWGIAKSVLSSPMNSRKRLALDKRHTAATPAWSIHDVMDMVKMAAPTVVFSKLSNVHFWQTRPKIHRKTAASLYILLHSYG